MTIKALTLCPKCGTTYDLGEHCNIPDKINGNVWIACMNCKAQFRLRLKKEGRLKALWYKVSNKVRKKKREYEFKEGMLI